MSLTGLKLPVALLLFLGFTLDGVEGTCSVEHCTDPTRCVLSKDQRSCKCALGFYADKCDRNAHLKVMCGKDHVAIRAAEAFFEYHGVPLESLHLPNKSCGAKREHIDGVPYYVFRVSKHKYVTCGGLPFEKNVTHIWFSLSVRSDPRVTGNIIRDPVIRMDFTCMYPFIRRVSLPFSVSPISSETVMRVDELEAKIRMMLYTDHTYTKPYTSSPTIELRDKVYVEVTMMEPADLFLLRVNECWATQYPQPNSTEGSVHFLLQNGCVKDQTVSFLNITEGQSGRNGQKSTVRYSFDMFRFSAHPHDLYLHCTVQLCDLDDHESCIPNCNSISKREAVSADPAQGLLTYGPIRIEVPDRSQSSVLLAVVLPVAAVWTLGFFLIILITVAKAGRKRLAKIEEQ
ncbi:zona pellucida glycoprotein d [Haplochromis burtoni]|uniref:zona pellucida glycoprotein d n=1 Tax=Haplochromis burtoni TaxID=8153 RepID=UPI0003BD8CAF|nr:zona pellucida glycoprotein d [Haplochromis burtoni]